MGTAGGSQPIPVQPQRVGTAQAAAQGVPELSHPGLSLGAAQPSPRGSVIDCYVLITALNRDLEADLGNNCQAFGKIIKYAD